MEGKKPVEVKEFSVDIRNRAMREALDQIPIKQLPVILEDCGLTAEEQKCLLCHRRGSELIGISEQLHVSDRTVDRRRASALNKLRLELEQ